ncbi:MAG: ABC transporter substrate-binding protein [Chloroflexota bacterium]
MLQKSKLFALTSLMILAALVMAACQPAAPAGDAMPAASSDDGGEMMDDAMSERAGQVILDMEASAADPENFNPYAPGRNMSDGVHQVMAEPLFILNYETGNIDPWLGASMTSNDAFDVWTLVLNEGITWSDGEAFNADDVIFTVNMLLDNAPELAYSGGMAEWVGSVEKVDDLTVTFNLAKPNARFQLDNFSVRIWGGPVIVPEHIWADQDPLTFKFYDPDKGWPVYTGPYVVSSVGENEFVYDRRDTWWGVESGLFDRMPHPKQAIWTFFGPEESRAAAMANGEIDSLGDITVGAFLALRAQNPNVIAHFDELPYAWVPDPCSRTFEMNHLVEPWDDPDMRWALNYAIDRDEIVAIAYEGSTLKSLHPFPAYPPLNRFVALAEAEGLYDKYPMGTHDPDQAAAIIESKGYAKNADGIYEKDGETLTLDIATHDAFIEKQRIAQVAVEQLQRVGIDATHRNEAGATWGDNFRNGEFEARMGWQTCGSVNEPWATMDTFNTKFLAPAGERAEKNAWRWSGDKADAYSAIVDEIGVLPLGDPAIDDLFLEATELWLSELPVIPVTEARKIIPFDTTYWTNWPTAENNYIHPPTWWQHFHAIIHELEPAQ